MAKKRAPSIDANTVALDLEGSLAARRSRAPASWESAQGIHKRRFTTLADEQAVSTLARDVSSALAEHVEDLSTQNHEFRSGMVRVFTRVLRLARERPEQVALFNEAVPGFTLLLFKKDPLQWGDQPQDPAPASPAAAARRARQASAVPPPAPAPAPEIAAAGEVIAQFVRRTGDRVLTVESDDALFVFFPASDVKKNLKEMGFYFTD